MRIVITTVHGTFARKSKWPRLDSPLGRYLRKHVPCEVEVKPFRWSGRNSFRKREKAALELRDELLTRTAEPDTKHFVIAHSHGGNVALLAAADPVLRERLEGIVCLATPFLQAWPRPLGTGRVIGAGAGVSITLANAVYFLLRGFVDGYALVLLVFGVFSFVNVVAMRLALRCATR